jgi:proteasome lid subunit RPN8/RPN11
MKYRLWLLMASTALLAQQTLANTPLQDKAIEVLRQAHDAVNGSIYEHGGMLVENRGTLRFIEPHPDNASPDSVNVTDRRALRPGDMLVGTYHTHPCMRGYYHQYFSTPDVIVAMFTAVPAFMLDECTGDVHEFFAAIDSIHDTGDYLSVRGAHCKKIVRHLPIGRIVGNVGVADPEHVNDEKDECSK